MSIRKWISYFMTMVVFLIFSVGSASAANGDNLTLTSSTVVDGDTNLSIRPIIELQFSGKVDDITILEHNKDCFHLQDANGNVLTLNVLFPDVQLQTRYVKHIFLTPEADLIPGASYTLTIDQTLSDKKLHPLDQSYRITFTTGTDEVYARGAENEDLLSLGDDVLLYQTALAPLVEDDASLASEDTIDQSTTESSSSRRMPIVITALIFLLGGVGFWNYRTSHRASTDE